MSVAAVSATALLAEDQQDRSDIPLRYAFPIDIDITPETHGVWQTLADGGRLWRMRFHSPGATDLNFGFSRFDVPEGATLYVSSEEHDYYEGPYDHGDVKSHGQLWLPVVPGERAVMELYVPANPKREVELHLTYLGAGYRDLFGLQGAPKLSKQGACNIDVVCPQGDAWRNEIRSVATYSLSGRRVCTGQLIADVPRSFRPFFLTANHCRVNSGIAPSMVVYWNFESPNCGDLDGGLLDDNQTGATFLAARRDVDFTLVELDALPDPAFEVYYSGWDRSGNTPQGAVGIHHPRADEKAISFELDPLETANSCIGTGGLDTHWQVTDWDEGTTEPGSSGSGIWDPDTKKLVGFLSGGDAACGNDRFDCYGKFSVAWDGLSPDSRLRDWLDPDNTGVSMVEGADAPPAVVLLSHGGRDECQIQPQNENRLWEPGEVIEVPLEIQSSENLSNVVGTITSTAPGVQIVDATAEWPDLEAGTPTLSNAPHVSIRLSGAVQCFSTVSFTVEITAAEAGPFLITPTHPVGSTPVPDVPVEIPDASLGSVGDLQIFLTSPAGTEVLLLDRPGFPESDFGCGNSDMMITFDDDSSFDPEEHCEGTRPWYEGDVKPVEALAAFAGELSHGFWTLTVKDNSGGDTGVLENWQLTFDPPAPDVCSVCGEPTKETDLLLSKQLLPGITTGVGRYAIAVRNRGPSTATGVMLQETLTGAADGISVPQGCTLVNRALSCAIGRLEAGTNRVINIELRRRTPARGRTRTVIDTQGQVSGNEPDPDPSNNGFQLKVSGG
jgi:hypothetical protein